MSHLMSQMCLAANLISSPSAKPNEFFGLGTGLEAKARLQILAKLVAKLPTAKDPLKTMIVNRFEKGNYARECHIKQNEFGVGKIHKLPHISIMSKGKCIVADLNGERIVEAPATFVSEAGIQRAVYALEDTIWTTIHQVGDLLNADSTEEEIRAVVSCDSYSDPALPLVIEGEIL